MTTKVTPGLTNIPLGTQNVIINGNFNIWQRGTSFPALTSGKFSADRFVYGKVGTTVQTVAQSTDVPTIAESGVHSNYSLLMDCTTADVSIAPGDYALMSYRVEGYDYTKLAGGNATLSFWVKGAKTGIHCVAVRNGVGDRSYISEYTIVAADTWEKKTITIPFTETGGTWDYINGVGLHIDFILVAGTSLHTTKDAWQVGNFLATSSQVNEVDNVANNFHIAQVQLEKGDVATPFTEELFADEVTRCERYFQKSYNLEDAPGTLINNGTVWETQPRNSATLSRGVTFQTKMRDNTPTILIYSSQSGAAGYSYNTIDRATIGQQANSTGIGYVNVTGGITSDHLYWHWTADGELP